MNAGPQIEYAGIDWDTDGQPISRQFGDVYFSRHDGLAETRYVFLDHNQLAARWQTEEVKGLRSFVIAETGFGTGLNFLAAWQLWRTLPLRQHATLHFVSAECAPLHPADLRRALALFPELATLAAALCQQWPAPVQGLHRLRFDDGNVRLTLALGDALDSFSQMDFIADAWFLDGFAPACNPTLWQSALLTEVRRHSHHGTTFATFTAVGEVRRQLASLGFEVSKVRGYGHKREMLCGTLALTESAPAPLPPHRVAVIGAGLAGAATANSLATRGVQVDVFDSGEVASGASGNPQGALYIKPGVFWDDRTQLAVSGLLYSQRLFAGSPPETWQATGVIQLAWNEAEQSRQQKLLSESCYPETVLKPLTAEEASDVAGVPLLTGGLHFPASGWACPPALCRQWLQHTNIRIHERCEVSALTQHDQGWTVRTSDGAGIDVDAVVLCTAAATNKLLGEPGLPLRRVRGQITRLSPGPFAELKTVLCADGYIPPPTNGQLLIGATFNPRDPDPAVRTDCHAENLEKIASWMPVGKPWLAAQDVEKLEGRTAFRCASGDFQPIAGAITTSCTQIGEEQLSAGESDHQDDDQLVPGLYMNTAHGSRGLSTAPLLGEWLADIICHQPACLSAPLAKLVMPDRFGRRRRAQTNPRRRD